MGGGGGALAGREMKTYIRYLLIQGKKVCVEAWNYSVGVEPPSPTSCVRASG